MVHLRAIFSYDNGYPRESPRNTDFKMARYRGEVANRKALKIIADKQAPKDLTLLAIMMVEPAGGLVWDRSKRKPWDEANCRKVFGQSPSSKPRPKKWNIFRR